MKFLHIDFKSIRPWFILLACTDLFFIFLLWLASAEAFASIAVIILLFSLLLMLLGVYIDRKQQEKTIKLIEAFIEQPDEESVRVILSASGRVWHPLIHSVSGQLKDLSQSVKDKSLELQSYEEYIEEWTHEIKTPLSLALMVLDNHEEEMSPYVYKRMEYVRRAISSGVERMLYYSRLQAAHMDYQFEKIDISESIQESLKSFKDLYHEKLTSIQLELTALHVVSDKRVLAFMLSQIMSNAFKYCAAENGIVRIETWFDEDLHDICLSIWNNGKGVPEEDIPFLFDKGFTGRHSHRQNATGMGLYFVKKYAEKLSIKIQTPNPPGETGFTIYLRFPYIT